ncbi:hypothetical protein [Mameliella sediminis]|uniref:hypothetical protein n=1 Tax=Mameliella sediminis TaxID=2836866 RepID=UPI001C45582B|nr:hypothetical protein [Mameliella sediminis]MBV7397020.1 hypothetical protein [Mameliella sediminis]
MFPSVKSSFLAAALSLSAFAANAQQATLLEVPVNQAFAKGEINWDTALGQIEFVWAVLDINGVTHVCGATSASTSFAHSNTRKAFRKGWVKVGEKKVMTNLSFFNRAPRKSDLGQAKARCKPMSRNPGAGQRFLLGFDPVRVRL